MILGKPNQLPTEKESSSGNPCLKCSQKKSHLQQCFSSLCQKKPPPVLGKTFHHSISQKERHFNGYNHEDTSSSLLDQKYSVCPLERLWWEPGPLGMHADTQRGLGTKLPLSTEGLVSKKGGPECLNLLIFWNTEVYREEQEVTYVCSSPHHPSPWAPQLMVFFNLPLHLRGPLWNMQ